eukprot:1161944-Pelagomonas_calceolata.AAC.17
MPMTRRRQRHGVPSDFQQGPTSRGDLVGFAVMTSNATCRHKHAREHCFLFVAIRWPALYKSTSPPPRGHPAETMCIIRNPPWCTPCSRASRTKCCTPWLLLADAVSMMQTPAFRFCKT